MYLHLFQDTKSVSSTNQDDEVLITTQRSIDNNCMSPVTSFRPKINGPMKPKYPEGVLDQQNSVQKVKFNYTAVAPITKD